MNFDTCKALRRHGEVWCVQVCVCVCVCIFIVNIIIATIAYSFQISLGNKR